MGKHLTKSVILKFLLVTLYIVMLGSVIAFFVKDHDIAILAPQGTIADQQRSLMFVATLLMLVVVIPVFVLTFWIAWKYRASNTNAKHSPDWDGNRKLELLWWGLPMVIIAILAVITWNSSHALDPYRPLESDKKAVEVQVIALQWKWLFVYPEYGIATVNELRFPEKTPVNFKITADAPMNSFWIPSLGGQVYAMSGMSTKLHLMADKPGVYEGSSANISGEGFAGMRFKATSTTDADFAKWVDEVKRSPYGLNFGEYNKLARPTRNEPPIKYVLLEDDLYDKIIKKYMGPGHSTKQHDGMDK